MAPKMMYATVGTLFTRTSCTFAGMIFNTQQQNVGQQWRSSSPSSISSLGNDLRGPCSVVDSFHELRFCHEFTPRGTPPSGNCWKVGLLLLMVKETCVCEVQLQSWMNPCESYVRSVSIQSCSGRDEMSEGRRDASTLVRRLPVHPGGKF